MSRDRFDFVYMPTSPGKPRAGSPRNPRHVYTHPARESMNRANMAAGSIGGGQITMSPELFEKMYLSPQNRVAGDLRKRFGNPTPLALIGFLVCLSPLACQLMDWRKTGGPGVGASGIGTYYFFGGVLLLLGSIGEWILGNTFPFVVFGSFAAFWLCFAATLTPSYNVYGAYSSNTANPAEGLSSPTFLSSYGFFFLIMAFLCLVYLICSLRTNLTFFIIFFTLTVAFSLLAACYWELAQGHTAVAKLLQKLAGISCFLTCAAGWWLFVAVMLESLEFPFAIPVGDLTWMFSGKKTKGGRSEV